ncbi:MAG: hypothetical protein VKP62_10835 [Candidatus Sericytochromatia bacterium]|nr:hypothetical protein [Candidatus Sericytochromatia bacterium]
MSRPRPLWLPLLLSLTCWLTQPCQPALALGQVVIFRDADLAEHYRVLAAKVTKLQLRAAADEDMLKRRAKPLTCRATIREVYPPEDTQLDPDACRVVLALTSVSGHAATDLPAIAFWVPRPRALSLKRNEPVSLSAQVVAIEPNGAVAIEIQAPVGWLDVTDQALPSPP